eukprot:5765419-Pleurochrysis_carterae.AAC.1
MSTVCAVSEEELTSRGVRDSRSAHGLVASPVRGSLGDFPCFWRARPLEGSRLSEVESVALALFLEARPAENAILQRFQNGARVPPSD